MFVLQEQQVHFKHWAICPVPSEILHMKEESKQDLVVYAYNPALRRQKQNDLCKFEANLDYIERVCLNK